MRTINFLIVIIFLIIVISCDDEMNYNFSINNETEVELTIHYTTTRNKTEIETIHKNSQECFFNFSIVEGIEIDEIEIKKVFNEISIIMDSISSNVNYLSSDVWRYHQSNKTTAIYTLTVDSTHFE